jgi:hypothetical protein
LIALGTALEKVLGTALEKVLGTALGRSEGEHPVEAPDTTPSYK